MSMLVLDGTKLALYRERVEAWKRGERVAPVTVDMALTRACTFKCVYCYGQLQHNKGGVLTQPILDGLLEDFAEIGVQGVSLVSDGESTCSPHLEHTIVKGKDLGLAMALGTNGLLLDDDVLCSILPRLSYLRFNISAGEEGRYNFIMRPPREDAFRRVKDNINFAVSYKSWFDLPVTIGMQMVLMPEFVDQVIPLSKLAISLGVDYLVIKHCSDDEDGSLGVDYSRYKSMFRILQRAEKMSTSKTRIVVKWNKIREGNLRSYRQCYGPPFIIQLSGSGLVAPCGMLFGEKYKEYHIGNVTEQRFKAIWESERYWEVMGRLASPQFNAKKMCGCLCLQHSVNKALDGVVRGKLLPPCPPDCLHKEFL